MASKQNGSFVTWDGSKICGDMVRWRSEIFLIDSQDRGDPLGSDHVQATSPESMKEGRGAKSDIGTPHTDMLQVSNAEINKADATAEQPQQTAVEAASVSKPDGRGSKKGTKGKREGGKVSGLRAVGQAAGYAAAGIAAAVVLSALVSSCFISLFCQFWSFKGY